MSAASAIGSPALEVRQLTKRYGSVTALDEMSFEIRPREVVGLVGENGAGKSTLLKVLVGLVAPDRGAILRNGQVVRFRGVAGAARAGIGMVFQEQSLVPTLTVAENILLGAEGSGVRWGTYRWRTMNDLAAAQLAKIGSTIRPDVATEQLTFAERQMVELAKVLLIEDRRDVEPVILLDEPTSVLERSEIDVLFGQIARLRERASIVFVSHRIDEVLAVSDRMYVLRNGTVVAERLPADTDAAMLQRLMIGRSEAGSHYHEERQRDCRPEVRLEARSLRRDGCYRDVSFSVSAGEVVGLAGVQGAGREQLSRTMFGADSAHGGELLIDGAPVRFGSPRAAVRAGIGYLPAERRTEGIVAAMSVAENLSLAHIGHVCRGPLLDQRKERAITRSWIDRLRIRAPSTQTPIGRLSGGNQQKVVVARWLMSGTVKVLILDHPTRGLDVGAKSDVYALIRDLADAGVAVVLLADSLDETIALCHRVVVMKDGRVTAVVDSPAGAKPQPREILEHMV